MVATVTVEDRVEFFVVAFIVLFFYFLPTFIATSRKVVNAGSVFVVNLFFGWSVVGWVIALAMAVRTQTQPSNAEPSVQPEVTLSTLLPPPGWYLDPMGSGAQRWWDGSRWTEHVAVPGASPAVTLPTN